MHTTSDLSFSYITFLSFIYHCHVKFQCLHNNDDGSDEKEIGNSKSNKLPLLANSSFTSLLPFFFRLIP